MEIEALHRLFLASTGVCIDSRKLQTGELFFALKGPSFDGNSYAQQCLAQGASAAIVSDPSLKDQPGCYYVEDSLEALQSLARHHSRKWKGVLFSLTGSNGKTTTKELLHVALSTRFVTHSTSGNYNNEIGVPLTLLGLKEEHEVAVVEMGARHVGDIAFLCQIAEPQMGLITNIGRAHLETFGGIEGVLRGKTELFDWLKKNGGQVFLNTNDERLAHLGRRLPGAVSYPEPDLELVQAKPHLQLRYRGSLYAAELSGSYNFDNLAAAFAVATHLGADREKVLRALCSYTPDNWRSQLIPWQGNTIILDAYNANPDSMKGALENLVAMPQRERWAVLAGMNELGERSEMEHRQLGEHLSKLALQRVLLVGEDAAIASEGLSGAILLENWEEAAKFLLTEHPQDAAILVKGSRSYSLEKIMDKLKSHE